MTRHRYKAHLEGRAVKVLDEHGHPVEVRFAGTSDSRTVYAFVDRVGFIGGWRYPHRAQRHQRLVEAINQGVLYERMHDLPNGRPRRQSPVDLIQDAHRELQGEG